LFIMNKIENTPFDVTGLEDAKLCIAELSRRNDELKTACEAAKSANNAKTIFLANMSHEIRTPMNSILGFSELALDYEIPPKAREYLHNIRESANWLLSIINDILDISKIEAGSIELERIPFDMSELFFHCQSGLTHKANNKGLLLCCDAQKIPGKLVMGDPARLRQVITNLLSNAVKFTSAGSVIVMATVNRIEDGRATISFEVTDTGMGMTPQQMSRIFEPFAQADNSISRKFGGTGLGLTITKNIVDAMGGNLEVKSTPGVGTTFSFTLVLDLIEEAEALAILSQNAIIEKPNFVGEVLICEDNELNQIVICENLAKVGLKPTIAVNGKEVVDMVKDRLASDKPFFDLIFMDIYVPVMDGMEAASIITKMGVTTPIVALTANAIRKMPEQYKKSGMCDYLCKPFTSQDLWSCLSKYIIVESYSEIEKDHHSAEEQKMLKQLRLNFVTDNQETYSKLEMALKSGDIKTAHRLAHTVKSNAAHINETKLQESAATVEAKLEGGNNLLEKGQLNSFRLDIAHVLEKLMPLLHEANAKVVAQVDDSESVREIVARLEPLLAKKDPHCETMLDEICTIPDSEILIKMIENFKFRQAMQELENIKKRWGLS